MIRYSSFLYIIYILFFVMKLFNVFHVSYIQYKTSKEGSTMGITVSHSAMLAHCHALTQACGYTEGKKTHLLIYFCRLQASLSLVFSPSLIRSSDPEKSIQLLLTYARKREGRKQNQKPALVMIKISFIPLLLFKHQVC